MKRKSKNEKRKTGTRDAVPLFVFRFSFFIFR